MRHYLDGIYCKSEVTELLKNMQNPEMQNIIEEVADELWEENMEQPPFHSDIEHEQYRREAATLLKKINQTFLLQKNYVGSRLHHSNHNDWVRSK